MTRYLLGQAMPAEQESLEDPYAAEPELFEALVAVENELSDQYARRELSAADRAAFERHVLAHPRRRARSEFAQAFATQLEQWANADSRTSALPLTARFGQEWRALRGNWKWSFGLATAALLLLTGSVWLWRNLRQPEHTDVVQRTGELNLPSPGSLSSNPPLDTAQASPRPSASAPKASPSAVSSVVPSSVPAVLAFTLVGRVVRDADRTQRLAIPLATKQVQLKVNLDGEAYPQYHIRLRSSAGKEILVRTNLKPAAKQKFVAVNFPSNQLPPGDYFLVLSGVVAPDETDELVTYFFRVTRK